VHGRDGSVLRTLSGKPAAIVTFLSGVWPRRPKPVHCAEVGAALAAMHLAGRDFEITRANDLSLDGWEHLVQATAARAGEVQDGLGDEIAGEFAELAEAWPGDLPSGVIHADLFPDNVFFLHERLSGLIDFYFACNDAFAYDVAICLNAWCFEHGTEFNITKARRLLSGYREVREFGPEELEALPRLARGAALRFLLTRLYDWLNQVDGALVKPKDPLEYLAKLRFHRQVADPGAYGLD
jgi:homoserine kinase type II